MWGGETGSQRSPVNKNNIIIIISATEFWLEGSQAGRQEKSQPSHFGLSHTTHFKRNSQLYVKALN